VDSVGKKIKVINDVKEKLALDNITAYNERVENLNF
jgi:16S rRNA G527 N7-methylase RsmG